MGDAYFKMVTILIGSEESKAPVTKAVLWGFKTDITHDRLLGMSVNIPTKAFCSPMKVVLDTFGLID